MAVAVAALVGGAVLALQLLGTSSATQQSAARLPPATAEITRGAIVETGTVTGTLGYGDETTASLGIDNGMITWLAEEGAILERGQPLYAVDGLPIPLFYGTAPPHRTLRFDGATYDEAVWVELETARKDAADATLKLALEQARLAAAEAERQNLEKRAADARSATPQSAAFAQLMLAVSTAEARLAGLRKLHATKAASQSQIDTAENELALARANLEQARLSLTHEARVAEVDLASARVSATAAQRESDSANDRLAALEASPPTAVDIAQIKENLVALGYSGPAAEAVRAWQAASGLPATGAIEPGWIVVAPGPVRIANHIATVGERLGGGSGDSRAVLTYSGTQKQVAVALDIADQGLAVVGREVGVTLPDDREVEGVIATVGATVTEGKIEVAVDLPDQSAVATYDAAPVDVEFVSDRREDVLSVPVMALLARPEGGFGVEIVEGAKNRIVPVRTGLFGSGRVEISGDEIAEGFLVGVPQ